MPACNNKCNKIYGYKSRPLYIGYSYQHQQAILAILTQNTMGFGGGGHGHSNLKYVVTAFLAPLPSILFYLSFLNHINNSDTSGSESESDPLSLANLWTWCYHHPLLLANALFFLNVNLLFWVISHIQNSHWVRTLHRCFFFFFNFFLTLMAFFVCKLQMIDLFWTVIPLMLVHYYATHPLGHYNWWRSRIAMLMTWVWSLRLSHNYFRRENWQWGAREDWRFTDMSRQYGKHWWWVSFFAVYASQQVNLVFSHLR